MSLSRGEINPLGVLGQRRLTFIPHHFTKIKVDKEQAHNIKMLDHWITYNLNSRYAIRKTLYIGPDAKMSESIEVGIEDPKELTLLTLGCPYLHKK